MFTGIIKETGTITAIDQGEDGARITVSSTKTTPHTQLGSSVCHSGICLTVVEKTEDSMSFDVMNQTLRLTALGDYQVGDELNLEGSMRVGDEVGGHFIYGHVDGVATVEAIQKDGDATIMTITPPEHLMKYIAPQGSVAIDGISLTVAALHEKSFDVSLLEFTMKETTLRNRSVGDKLNLEVDMMMKYLERLVDAKQS